MLFFGYLHNQYLRVKHQYFPVIRNRRRFCGYRAYSQYFGFMMRTLPGSEDSGFDTAVDTPCASSISGICTYVLRALQILAAFRPLVLLARVKILSVGEIYYSYYTEMCIGPT